MNMILLYTMLMLLMNAFKAMLSWRARMVERKYVKLAAAVAQLVREAEVKPGNGKLDPIAVAKRVFLLGELAQKRDRVEANYFGWQRWADCWAGWSRTLHAWQGKKLPYTLGAVDVWMLLGLVDYLGVGQYVSTQAVVDAITALIGN
jgi:hypothetical protein